MAHIGAKMVYFLAAVLLHVTLTANGASLTAEQSSHMMRRDARAQRTSALELNPAGEMLAVDASEAERWGSALQEEASASQTQDGDFILKANKRAAVVPEGCNDVFPLGKENSDDCGNFSAILDDGQCREAADQWLLKFPKAGLLTAGDKWENMRPKGCFKFKCSEDAESHECLFFNDRDHSVNESQIVGTPVCLKKRFMTGTAVPGQADSCPDGYEEIDNEDICRVGGTCKEKCEGAEFRKGMKNANESNSFPPGCFIHDEEGCVYFNPRNVTGPGGEDEALWKHPKVGGSDGTFPSAPKGTPLCVSKEELYMKRAREKAARDLNASKFVPPKMTSGDPDSVKIPKADNSTLVEVKADSGEKETSTDNEFCLNDYPKGHTLQNHCVGANHSNILQQAVCRDAAKDAGVEAPKHKFIIDSTWYMKRPRGCFAMKCKESSHGMCYFFNGAPLIPTNISGGTPICKRPKFANGTSIPDNTQNGCPSGYSAIMHEETCKAAGECLGYCKGPQFREGVWNKTLHDMFPIGCFIHPFDGCVYYNFPETGHTAPTRPHPQAVPICNVSSVTKWAAS